MDNTPTIKIPTTTLIAINIGKILGDYDKVIGRDYRPIYVESLDKRIDANLNEALGLLPSDDLIREMNSALRALAVTYEDRRMYNTADRLRDVGADLMWVHDVTYT